MTAGRWCTVVLGVQGGRNRVREQRSLKYEQASDAEPGTEDEDEA